MPSVLDDQVLRTKYRTARKNDIPKWATANASALIGPMPLRPSRHVRIPLKVPCTSTSGLTSSRPTSPEGNWEVVSDASGTEENGTAEAHEKQERIRRHRREQAFQRDVEAAKCEASAYRDQKPSKQILNAVHERVTKRHGLKSKEGGREWLQSADICAENIKKSKGSTLWLGSWW